MIREFFGLGHWGALIILLVQIVIIIVSTVILFVKMKRQRKYSKLKNEFGSDYVYHQPIKEMYDSYWGENKLDKKHWGGFVNSQITEIQSTNSPKSKFLIEMLTECSELVFNNFAASSFDDQKISNLIKQIRTQSNRDKAKFEQEIIRNVFLFRILLWDNYNLPEEDEINRKKILSKFLIMLFEYGDAGGITEDTWVFKKVGESNKILAEKNNKKQLAKYISHYEFIQNLLMDTGQTVAKMKEIEKVLYSL